MRIVFQVCMIIAIVFTSSTHPHLRKFLREQEQCSLHIFEYLIAHSIGYTIVASYFCENTK